MKKHISIFIFSLIVWGFCIGGCEKDRNGDPIKIIAKNNLADTVCFVTQFNYPDTNLINFTATSEARGTTVYPNSESRFWAFSGWEREIKERNSKEVLIIVVYSHDTLQKYSFDQIQSNYNILRRYDLTIEQLRALNWTVTYP